MRVVLADDAVLFREGLARVLEAAVESHIANVFSKLGLFPAVEEHRRVLAVLTYLEAR